MRLPPESRSIKQNATPDALPNFRNLGVTLRILMLSNLLALINGVLQAASWPDLPVQILQTVTLSAPVLLTGLLLLWASQDRLLRLGYWEGVWVVNCMVALLTLLVYSFWGEFYRLNITGDRYFEMARGVFLGVAGCSLMLMYFRLRARILSHAIEDARLQVLRARIRPHFLYNTINAVLGIVRTQPRQAETALEDMADLFRMAMADERDLVPLLQEIKLCQQYIALEKLRMGDRLRMDWQLADMPDDAFIPPLLLQPLLENAVYHGIEPLIEGGCIQVLVRRLAGKLKLVVINPCAVSSVTHPHQGNKIALQNIRLRLALLFDAEASYQVAIGSDHYQVEIVMPYVKEKR